jgi:hypothetical protein
VNETSTATDRAEKRAKIQASHPTYRVWETLPYATRCTAAGGTTVMGRNWDDLAAQLDAEDE